MPGPHKGFDDLHTRLGHGSTGSDLAVQLLHLVSLLQSSGVSAQSLLGELIHLLLRTSAASLEHIEQSLLIGGQTNDLAHQLSNELGSLGDSL